MEVEFWPAVLFHHPVARSHFSHLSLVFKMRYSLLASLVIGATVVVAHPAVKENAWKKNLNKRSLSLDQFRTEPNSDYSTSQTTKVESAKLALLKRADFVETATELVKSVFPDAEFRVGNSYVGTNGIGHVYFKQTIHGLDIDNADFNVNVSGTTEAVLRQG